MPLLIEFDPAGGATHRLRWEIVGEPGDKLTPEELQATTARLTRVDEETATSGWLLTPEVASPIADQLSTAGVVLVIAYIPRDYQQMLEFDRRITQRYTEFCASTGEYYAGTVTCRSWEPEFLGELVWFDEVTLEAVEAVGADIPVPDDVQAIVTECRDLQNRERTRHNIYFEPIHH